MTKLKYVRACAEMDTPDDTRSHQQEVLLLRCCQPMERGSNETQSGSKPVVPGSTDLPIRIVFNSVRIEPRSAEGCMVPRRPVPAPPTASLPASLADHPRCDACISEASDRLQFRDSPTVVVTRTVHVISDSQGLV